MTIMNINYERDRGDTYADELKIISSATNQAIDITNYSFVLTLDSLRNPEDESTHIYSIIGQITNPEQGVVEFTPTVDQSNQPPAVYFYDIQMTDSVGRVRTIQKGKYKYMQDITK
jgi:hypothetical protein